MPIAIRPLAREDLQVVAEIQDASWRRAYRGIIPDYALDEITVQKRRDKFERRFEQQTGETAIIEHGGQIAGFVSFGRCRDEDAQNGAAIGELWGIYLAPDRWRKGIGRQALHWVQEALIARGYHQMTLWVLEQNHPARRFYEAMGFVHDGTQQQITIGVPLSEIRYRKTILSGSLTLEMRAAFRCNA